jgi:hypothetical protein
MSPAVLVLCSKQTSSRAGWGPEETFLQEARGGPRTTEISQETEGSREVKKCHGWERWEAVPSGDGGPVFVFRRMG